MTISVGGEIGEVGKSNSTEARAPGLPRRAHAASWRAFAPGAIGISKVSVQTGTSHGGVVLPDGSVAKVAVDFDVHRRLGAVARERVRAGRHRAARRVHAPRRDVPHVPRGRDGRDPPRDRLPERALRAPGLPGRAPREDRGLVLRERARRAQAGPDGPAVRLHDPQEGDRAVQARAVGPRHEGRDPRGAGGQDRVPVPRARRRRVARDGGSLRAPRRAAPAGARRDRGGRRRRSPSGAA